MAGALLERAAQLEDSRRWDEATAYYQRYLLLKPDDSAALAKLAEAYGRGEPTRDRLERHNNLLYRVLGQDPKRDDLRLQLAENLLKLGDFRLAIDEAEQVSGGPELQQGRRKVVALAEISLVGIDPQVALPDAVAGMLAAADEAPGDVELVPKAADVLRRRASDLSVEGLDPIARADDLMDRLVNADPRSVDARLARYRYRRDYQLGGADDDLQAALDVDPDHVEALLESAIGQITAPGSSDEALAAAEAQLRHAIELAPQDHPQYLALAALLERRGQPDQAMELLQKGRAATDDNINLDLALVEIQSRAARWDDVEETLRRLDARSALFQVQLAPEARIKFENRLRLAHARLDLGREEFPAALGKLRTIYISEETVASTRHTREWLQAAQLLAACHGRLDQWDQAAEYWRVLLKARPGEPDLVVAAVDAMLKGGDPAGAAAALDDLSPQLAPNEALLVQRVRAHLALQLARPPADRNWTEFQLALQAAQAQSPDRWELVIYESNGLLAGGDAAGAVALLRRAEAKYAENAAFWAAAAQLYSLLDVSEDRDRALDRRRALAPSAAEQIAFEARLLAAEGRHDEADALLADADASLPPEVQRRLARQRVETRVVAGDLAGARQLVERLIDAEPPDPSLLPLGIEIALAAGDLAAAEDWEGQLRAAFPEGSEAQYWRARRLLQTFDELSPEQKQNLDRDIAELRSARPRWYPVVALAARRVELAGDARAALAEYQLAVDLGDRRSSSLQSLTTLLYQFGRFQDAERYLSLLVAAGASGAYVDAMGVELAVRQDRLDQALAAARQAVDEHPVDPPRRLFLANLLLRSGQAAEAVDALRTAMERFPADDRLWSGLIAALIQAGRLDEARESLTELAASTVVPVARRHLAAAQGYEALGDGAAAARQYQLAVAQQPDDPLVRLPYAKLLIQWSVRAARSEFETVLRLDPTNAEARRALATLLAATGVEADWARATELLNGLDDGANGDAGAADRFRALLLSHKGRTRAERIANCQAARQILARQIGADGADSADLSRLMLAKILERQSALSGDLTLLAAARDEYRAVVDHGPPNAEELSQYLEFLLQHAPAPGAAPPTPQEQSFLADAEAGVDQLRQLHTSAGDGIDALAAAYSARILVARAEPLQAQAQIADYAAQQNAAAGGKPTPAQLVTIGQMYTSIGAHAEAEELYRKLTESTPGAVLLVVQSLLDQGRRREAATLCLETSGDAPLTPQLATVLATVMIDPDGPAAEDFSDAEAALAAALEAHSRDLNLLQAAAVMHISRREYDAAIALLRRILAIDPDNDMALNNLATVLAERPNQRAEALELIERAVALSGRLASLMDTQGTIYLKLGDAQQAIACLEEATAGGEADARYYLHLAAAYRLAERDEDARRMLHEARDFGLEKFVLTDDDRALLMQLEQELGAAAPGEQL